MPAMHRAINIKHRVVKRVDICKAPLATFDTIDLGDEDGSGPESPENRKCDIASETQLQHSTVTATNLNIKDGGLKSGTIGGNSSKKSLSQVGGEEKRGGHEQAAEKAAEQGDHHVRPTGNLPCQAPISGRGDQDQIVCVGAKAEAAAQGHPDDAIGPGYTGTPPSSTIGRVNIPIKKQDSESSTSSCGTPTENPCSFQSTRPNISQIGVIEAKARHSPSAAADSQCMLLPENLDPSQILSPSKRKAYERRIERLKVTTSPIARPRSTAPISVVTLDEYANISSSPEASPASPSHIQDKLKITLPIDEFTKPKTPKLSSARQPSSEERERDANFEFTEEILFSRTKSALVVEEDGQLPLSPRRVLIPPSLTPATSPKLSASPRLSSAEEPSQQEEAVAPRLVYIQECNAAQKFFGETVDDPDQDNWANFADSPVSLDQAEVGSGPKTDIDDKEKADLEDKEKDTLQKDEDSSTGSAFPTGQGAEAGILTEKLEATSLLSERIQGSQGAVQARSALQVCEGGHLAADGVTPEDLSLSGPPGVQEEILTVGIQECEETRERKIEIDLCSSSGASSPVESFPASKSTSDADLDQS